ncbi:CBS domain-containing protein [uncultured Paludibaculum sp.]|uniref:CBS domain-containing protein n=1 Tax=uncultured Paludibaculum sp. TaxID=1765020 RepID=UPI002AAC3187|nr:CBS domain-containing protein [uncultured Paludibaculum sp.]
MKPTAKIGSLLGAKGSAIWAVEPKATVYDAIAMMADKGVGALLVMHEGRLAGIISERDYTRKVILKGRSSKEELVEEIMTANVVTATPEHTVEEVMRLMTERRIRHLPILEGEKVAGVISIGDLVKWTISAQEETIAHLTNYISGSYGVAS